MISADLVIVLQQYQAKIGCFDEHRYCVWVCPSQRGWPLHNCLSSSWKWVDCGLQVKKKSINGPLSTPVSIWWKDLKGHTCLSVRKKQGGKNWNAPDFSETYTQYIHNVYFCSNSVSSISFLPVLLFFCIVVFCIVQSVHLSSTISYSTAWAIISIHQS